jgi:phosphoglycerate dehydrogenase-like enzyme
MDIAVIDDFLLLSQKTADWKTIAPDVRITVFSDHAYTDEALIERLQWFDVVCVMRERTRLTRAVLSKLPRLKLIVTSASKNPAVDMDAATDYGIQVCGTVTSRNKGYSSSEITIALMLSVARWIPQERDSMRANGWQSRVGVALAHRTLGIIGFGRLARQVAVVAKAMMMEVITFSRSLSEAEAAEIGVKKVDRDTLFRESDFLNVQLLLTPETTGVIGAREIGLMKPTAYLINAARGPIVDEAALIDALVNRRIAGAGLDVYDYEPLQPDHPFRYLPNVVATPHIGFATEEAYQVFYEGMVETIKAFAAGNPVWKHNEIARTNA